MPATPTVGNGLSQKLQSPAHPPQSPRPPNRWPFPLNWGTTYGHGRPQSSRGFLKLQRGEITEFLLRDPNGFALAALIALRARFNDAPGPDGLGFGQARVGDHSACGLSRKEYRSALGRLERLGLIRIQSSRRGTIATLVDSRMFALRDDRGQQISERKHPVEGPRVGQAKSRFLRQRQKNGHQKGHLEGHRLSEENHAIGANDAANGEAKMGPTKGQQGATNQNDQNGSTADVIPFGEERGSSVPPPSRPRDPLFDALAEATDGDPHRLTKPALRCVGVALAGIRATYTEGVDELSVNEIRRRAGNYIGHFPGATLTAHALAKHWARCDRPSARNGAHALNGALMR